MSELTVIAKAKAKSGHEKELEREMRAVVGPSHKESGCIRYALHRSIEDPATFVMVERWVSKEALDQHFTTPHIKVLLEKVMNLITAPPEITVLELIPEGQPDKGTI